VDGVTYRLTSDGTVAGAEPIHLTIVDDLVYDPGVAGALQRTLRSETVSVYGHPAQFLALTPTAGVTTAKDYPDDGSGLVSVGSGGSSIVLNLAPPEAAGLIVLILAAANTAGIGQVRQIVSVSGTTATVDRGWGSGYVPANGDTYRLLVPGMWRAEWHVKVEFANAKATDPTMTLAVALYDYPQTPPGSGTNAGRLGILGTGRAARRFMDRELTIDNMDLTGDSTQSGYRQGRTESGSIRGAIGFKVRPTGTLPVGAFALYGAAT